MIGLIGLQAINLLTDDKALAHVVIKGLIELYRTEANISSEIC
jgi:hypothetical protein